MQRALAEIALIGARRRARSAAGSSSTSFSYAAESLAHSIFPGLVLADARRRPAAARRGAGDRRRGAGDRRSPARVAGVGRDVAVAVVVTTMFGARRPARPLAGLAAGDRDAALRRHPRRPPTPTCSPPRRSPSLVARRALRCCTAGCWRPASTAAPPAPSASRPARRRRRAAAPARGGDRRRRAGARQPARRRRLRRPGRGGAPAHRPDRCR